MIQSNKHDLCHPPNWWTLIQQNIKRSTTFFEKVPLIPYTMIWQELFVSTPLAAENVSAACVGWGKYAQIRERDPDRFSATLRAHLGLYDLCIITQSYTFTLSIGLLFCVIKSQIDSLMICVLFQYYSIFGQLSMISWLFAKSPLKGQRWLIKLDCHL